MNADRETRRQELKNSTAFFDYNEGINDNEGLKRCPSLQRFDTKSDSSETAWMTALMEGDHVPDYPTPFDTFITRPNKQLNRAWLSAGQRNGEGKN